MYSEILVDYEISCTRCFWVCMTTFIYVWYKSRCYIRILHLYSHFQWGKWLGSKGILQVQYRQSSLCSDLYSAMNYYYFNVIKDISPICSVEIWVLYYCESSSVHIMVTFGDVYFLTFGPCLPRLYLSHTGSLSLSCQETRTSFGFQSTRTRTKSLENAEVAHVVLVTAYRYSEEKIVNTFSIQF